MAFTLRIFDISKYNGIVQKIDSYEVEKNRSFDIDLK